MIELNITVLIQLVNFVIALTVMNYLLIAPVRKIIRQRRDLASGLLRETEEFTAQSTEKLENYEAVLARAREDATVRRDADKAAALAREVAILEDAQREAQAFLKDARDKTRAQVDAAMREIRADVPTLAEKAAAALLNKKSVKKTGR